MKHVQGKLSMHRLSKTMLHIECEEADYTVCTMGHDTDETEQIEINARCLMDCWNACLPFGNPSAIAGVVGALEAIANPLAYIQREAEKEGNKIVGMVAVQLSADPEFLKGLARNALAALKPTTAKEEAR